MKAVPATRRLLLDTTAVVLLLLIIIVVGFAPTFDGPAYLIPALGGLVLGVGLGVAGARLRWGVLSVAAAAVGAYVVAGTALAVPDAGLFRVVPTLESLRQLAVGVVTSWKRLVTTVPPLTPADGYGIVPFLLLLAAGVLTASLALRLRRPAWALLPAAAALVVQIAVGTSQPAAPVIQGLVFAAVVTVWLSVRQAWRSDTAVVALDETGDTLHAHTRRRIAAGAGIIAVALVAGVATAGVAAPAGPRYVLRDTVIPPFDVHDYASPLQSYRKIVRDDKKTTLFTVDGLPDGARVRVAAMDAYTGVVYDVSDGGYGSASAFTAARAGMSPDAAGTPATVQLHIGKLDGVWMPTVGAVHEIDFSGPQADALRRGALYNAATSTGVESDGLRSGDRYTLRTSIPARPSDAALAKAKIASVRVPTAHGVPTDFASIAAEITADASTPVAQLRALQKHFSEDGFFSDGLDGEEWSLPGHGAARISTLLHGTQMVGDDEQYAVAMALLAGQLGIPSRVVMGYYPDDDKAGKKEFAATGEDLHAWVEVPFEKYGWVRFDPTPPKDNVPDQQATKPRSKPKPQVLQPPPPQQQVADEPPTVPAEHGGHKNDHRSGVAAVILTVLLVGGIGLGSVLVVLSPFLVMGAVKASRRRRRRRAERAADRITGGWDELRDRAVDYGAPVTAGSTRTEDAAAVGVVASASVATLAARADAQVWGPGEPAAEEVDAFWDDVDDAVSGLRRDHGFWRGLRARLSVRSLRRRPGRGTRRGAHHGGRENGGTTP